MAAPIPKPTQLRIVQGNPGKRPLNENEPIPSSGLPKPPRHLSAEAKREWRRISKELAAASLLTRLDADALALYCETYARWVEATRRVQHDGLLVETPNGYPVQSPYLAIANKAQAQLTKLLTEFGMTPASRSRVSVPKGKGPDDDLDELFDGDS